MSHIVEIESRNEQPWDSTVEDHVRSKIKFAKEQSVAHDMAYRHFNRLHWYLSIPTVIIPVIFASLTALLQENEQTMRIVNALGFLATGVLTSYATVAQYSEKKERQASISTRYNDVATELEDELVYLPQYRSPADRVLVRTQMAMINITRTAPPIPTHILKSLEIDSGSS